MGKIKGRIGSLKWRFFLYFPICLLIVFLGSMAIGMSNNYLQEWYMESYANNMAAEGSYMKEEVWLLHAESDGKAEIYLRNIASDLPYWLISNIQTILIPLWVIFCIGLTGGIYYHRELKKPIEMLLQASGKISQNELDFEINYKSPDEMGALCEAVEEMRAALYENNRQMWRALEERRRLNSAFAHDLRTPLTVLQGYVDYLQKYIPTGQVSEVKQREVLGMMAQQVARLTNYTYKMSDVQKLEDVELRVQKISVILLESILQETGKLICGSKSFHFEWDIEVGIEHLFIDMELFQQLYENLLSNAVRYAKDKIWVSCKLFQEKLQMVVKDDGEGFEKEALQHALEPFYRSETDGKGMHFGLGLYICRIICEKCGGKLEIANWEEGAMVSAEIICEKPEKL